MLCDSLMSHTQIHSRRSTLMKKGWFEGNKPWALVSNVTLSWADCLLAVFISVSLSILISLSLNYCLLVSPFHFLLLSIPKMMAVVRARSAPDTTLLLHKMLRLFIAVTGLLPASLAPVLCQCACQRPRRVLLNIQLRVFQKACFAILSEVLLYKPVSNESG